MLLSISLIKYFMWVTSSFPLLLFLPDGQGVLPFKVACKCNTKRSPENKQLPVSKTLECNVELRSSYCSDWSLYF